MQVNSVTSYNYQSSNGSNIKFGDCKKIVCDKYMVEAKEAFDKSSLKQGLDKMYRYETHFRTSNKGYSMILKPYKGSLLYRLKNHFNHDFKLPNLPCELEYKARCLEGFDSFLTLGMDPISANARFGLSKEEGLIDKIKRLTAYDIREKIKKVLDNKAQ